MQAIDQDILATANGQSRRLRDLVGQPGTLVMPGAYDGLSARLFESMGFQAIQCSSGGIAAGQAQPDGEMLTREQTLSVSRTIAGAVAVPVNGDGERGYGEAHEVGDTVRGYIEAGCAGMNIEDSAAHLPGEPFTLIPVAEHLEKLDAMMATKRELGSEFFVNARVDSFMAFRDDPGVALEEGIVRGKAYAAAGADCIFFIGATSPDAIGQLVRGIPAPVSILAGAQTPPLALLQELGVARVSYGYAFALAAGAAIRRLAAEVLESGTITGIRDAMTVPELAQLMQRTAPE